MIPEQDLVAGRTFDELQVGDSASLTRTASLMDARLFAALCGEAEASPRPGAARPPHRFAGELWAAALLAAVIEQKLPGPGAALLEQALVFHGPAPIGEAVTATVRVVEKRPERTAVALDCQCVGAGGEVLVSGRIVTRAPTDRIYASPPDPAGIRLALHDRYRLLLEAARGGDPAPTAVAHPCDAAAIQAVAEAAKAGLIAPVLVGPEEKIRSAAAAAGVDISAFPLVAAPHSHAAAAQAVALAGAGKVHALMKGSLHTDELMGAVVSAEGGLRTERRISHVYVMDVPGYPRPLLITDAAVNIAPDLAEKRDIVQNAIELAQVIGIARPRVAILSAVETVNPKMCSTLDAAALCKMADRGQITGGTLDGPLALDNAISPAAAAEKGIVSPVAGQADILVVPDLEAGNMLAKQLTFLAGADAAGLVLGARVPIILTSRADSTRTRIASCALAVLAARARQRPSPGSAAGGAAAARDAGA